MPPDTATNTRSSRCDHLEVVDRLDHLAAAELHEVLGTEVGVVPRQVDDRRTPTGSALRTGGHHHAPPEITGRISTTSSSSELGVARHERAVADHQMRFAVQFELGEQRVHPARPGHFDLAPRVAQQHLHLYRGEQRARCARVSAAGSPRCTAPGRASAPRWRRPSRFGRALVSSTADPTRQHRRRASRGCRRSRPL